MLQPCLVICRLEALLQRLHGGSLWTLLAMLLLPACRLQMPCLECCIKPMGVIVSYRILSGIQILKLNCYTHDAPNRPVLRELTCVARICCLLAEPAF